MVHRPTAAALAAGTTYPSPLDASNNPTTSTANNRITSIGYAYDAAGQLVAEYSTQATSGGTSYLTQDQLGSTRIVTDGAGNPTSRHDYLPFGEEIKSNVGGRDTVAAPGYNLGSVSQKFTKKERDTETGLDFFQKRYYASSQGRFTGVDFGDADLNTPQSLNKYQYCLNNPLRYVDANGLYNRDVHYDLTRVLAYAVGFSEVAAAKIAEADQYVDDNPATSAEPTKYDAVLGPTGGYQAGLARRKLWHFTTAARRRQLWAKFLNSGSLDDLGTYLHAEQDSYSHIGLSPVNGQVTLSDPRSWADADDTWRRVGLADEMAEDTYNVLADALDELETKAHSSHRPFYRYPQIPWTRISDLVHEFNSASTEEEKRYYIMLIENRVRMFRYEQEKKRMKEETHRQSVENKNHH